MVFTNVGRNMIRDWLSGGGYSTDKPLAMALGSGTTSALITDTILQHEIGSSSNPGSVWRIGPFTAISLASQEVRYEAIFPCIVGSETTFSELDIFSRSGTGLGSMYARTTFTPAQKSINEEWDILYYFKLN